MWIGVLWMACAPPAAAPTRDDATASLVRDEIAFAWDAYERLAWGEDELQPISQRGASWLGQTVGLTPIDAWDTLHTAGLTDRADRAQAWIDEELSFDVSGDISAFELNIRLGGGLMAMVELGGDDRALELALDLAGRSLPAFDTPTGMPRKSIDLRARTASNDRTTPADAGSWLLEWAALSRASGDPTWEDAARAALIAVHQTRDPSTGLIGAEVDVTTGALTLPVTQVGGGVDSYLEYLLKGGLMRHDPSLIAAWHEATDPLVAAAATTTPEGTWYGLADATTGAPLAPVTGALSCYVGGMLALGGDLDAARAAAEACHAGWTTWGMLPDAFAWEGRLLVTPSYELRPEYAETLFYLWRLDHDPRWRDYGRQMLDDLKACCRTPDGYTTVRDVRTGEHGDAMPSYFLAETLKYLYLLFAEDTLLPLDAVVFNTEAHPLARDPG